MRCLAAHSNRHNRIGFSNSRRYLTARIATGNQQYDCTQKKHFFHGSTQISVQIYNFFFIYARYFKEIFVYVIFF